MGSRFAGTGHAVIPEIGQLQQGDADVLRKAMGKETNRSAEQDESSVIRRALPAGTPERHRWKKSGKTGKHLPNMHSTNRIPPVTLLWLIKRLI